MNYEAVYRTAPATPGLLGIFTFCFGLSLYSIQAKCFRIVPQAAGICRNLGAGIFRSSAGIRRGGAGTCRGGAGIRRLGYPPHRIPAPPLRIPAPPLRIPAPHLHVFAPRWRQLPASGGAILGHLTTCLE